MVPRCACAGFYTVCGGLMVLHDRWSALSLRDAHRPHLPSTTSMAMATALQPHGHRQRSSISGASACTPNFSVNVFIVFCSHPGWARPGALVGVFAVSAVLHDLGMWGLGWEKKKFRTAGVFFLLMGVGAALEHGYKKVTGRHVGGLWSWVWTRCRRLVGGTR
jgi:hypothetical protein